MTMDNDTRGWIMSSVSGIACVLGSSIICVDFLVRLFPGKKAFKIQNSNEFLSASLSLSFGVMLFSALYSMLPSANTSLQRAGFSPRASAYLVIGYFIGGVIVIQVVSRILHRYMPSEVIDCDHIHEPNDKEGYGHHGPVAGNHHHASHESERQQSPDKPTKKSTSSTRAMEHTPLLSSDTAQSKRPSDGPGYGGEQRNGSLGGDSRQGQKSRPAAPRRPSLTRRLKTQMSSLVFGEQSNCDEGGPCYGYSDPCAQRYIKYFPSIFSDGRRRSSAAMGEHNKPQFPRSATAPFARRAQSYAGPVDEEAGMAGDGPSPGYFGNIGGFRSSIREGDMHNPPPPPPPPPNLDGEQDPHAIEDGTLTPSSKTQHEPPSHHHHVPTNAFLSIGLQTSLAIALHKLPEGFITYATNHANPHLGVTIFMAIFIHNITEGFAMALPLFLALGSRWRAMLWSSLLGGVTQPLGAGVAALWFKLAGRSDMAPGEGVYGGMFAVTAGVMTSVALQLFSESLGLNHNHALCIVFAFIGMTILGISFALTAS
ncbi:MAG: hypothetical protein M1816_004351 [Peltula sp. TS41687]|nr:MAG: hypothetical protein M1816_004351 [Peltula sp. TS41687]